MVELVRRRAAEADLPNVAAVASNGSDSGSVAMSERYTEEWVASLLDVDQRFGDAGPGELLTGVAGAGRHGGGLWLRPRLVHPGRGAPGRPRGQSLRRRPGAAHGGTGVR